MLREKESGSGQLGVHPSWQVVIKASNIHGISPTYIYTHVHIYIFIYIYIYIYILIYIYIICIYIYIICTL